MLCQALVTHFCEETRGKEKQRQPPQPNKYLTCQLEVVHFVRKGSCSKKGLAKVMSVISLWLIYNENNIITHDACNRVDAGRNGGDGEWVCKTEIRYVLYWLLLLGGGQQGNLLSKSECA